MARQVRAELTRRAILDAAAAVFDEQGFPAASLADIVAKAGVTKGALYFHFSSKEELALALIDEQFAGAEEVDTANAGVQTAIDLCHHMARNLQENIRVRASIWLAIEQGPATEAARRPWRRWVELLAEIFVAAKRRGDLREGLEPGEVAAYVTASFSGVQLSSHVLAGRADIRERVTVMWRIILPGIVPAEKLSAFDPAGTPLP